LRSGILGLGVNSLEVTRRGEGELWEKKRRRVKGQEKKGESRWRARTGRRSGRGRMRTGTGWVARS